MDAFRIRNKIPYAASEGTSADISDGNKVIVKKADETFVNVDAGLFAKKSDTEIHEQRDVKYDYHVQVSAEGVMTYDEENVSSVYRCNSFEVKLGGVYNVLVTRTSARAFRGGVYANAPTEQASQNVIGNFQTFESGLSTSYTFTAEANGYYVVSYSRNTGNTITVSASETISIKDKLAETNEPNIDIDTIYPPEIVKPRLLSCRHDKGNSWESKTASLVLLHFSDIHADVEEISRIMQFKQKYSVYIDDVIHTGDLVRGYYGDGSLELVQEAYHFGDILQVIGNHDLAKSSEDAGHLLDPLTNVEAYNAYFKDYIANWGVTQPADAAILGKLYYYKDYPSRTSDVSKTIRLIVVNNFADSDAAQQAWFSSLLDDARTNNMAVVVADHSPFGDADMVNCNFNSMTEEYRINFFTPVNLSALVDDFIDAGGEFLCWINGHHHRDMFIERGRNKQLDVSINTGCYYANLTGSARRPQGCVRMPYNYTRDCFNGIAFDPVNKVVKIQRFGSGWDSIGHKQEWLSYNYATHTIMGNG
jgi:hypothetical protein